MARAAGWLTRYATIASADDREPAAGAGAILAATRRPA